jgi:hypothetical protein
MEIEIPPREGLELKDATVAAAKRESVTETRAEKYIQQTRGEAK